MKKTCLSLAVLALFSFLVGCERKASEVPFEFKYDKSVEVIIEKGDTFPGNLVGHWKADKSGWEIVFAPDGTILSAVIPLGRFDVKPGQLSTATMRGGGKSILKPGQWTVRYNYETRGLDVFIVFDDIHVEMGGGVLGGSVQYILIGHLTDEEDVWVGEWHEYSNYVINAGEYKDHHLPQHQGSEYKGPLVFSKVTKKS